MVGPDDAADVVSDALLSVASAGRLTGVDDVRAYLYRAVHNRVVDVERAALRRRRREAHVGAWRSSSPETDSSAAADARSALKTLSVRQRTAVFLTYWCGLTPAEVARVLDTSEGTVRKQLARARTRLREVLDG